MKKMNNDNKCLLYESDEEQELIYAHNQDEANEIIKNQRKSLKLGKKK